MRRMLPGAVILALLLVVVAGIVPAAVPGGLVPAALSPAVVLAADDIEITTATRYRVDPEGGRVRVVVDITAVNRKPNAVTGGTVTRYFYDGVNVGLQPEARSIHATQNGSPVKVEVARKKTFRLATILFRDNIYFGQTARVRLTFDLPGGQPRSDSDVRVGVAFVTFLAWAFGDRGSVRVEVPSGFRVDVAGEDMTQAPGEDGFSVYTDATSIPLDWYALVSATNDDALTRDRLALEGGDDVVVRAWPEDERWRSRVRTLLRDGVPELVGLIGLDWPVDGALSVTEVHTPLLEGYAGFYDTGSDEITISEDLDELTIVHEASHALLNPRLFAERWITEGLADEYAARVLRALDRGYPDPDPVRRTSSAAFALEDWPPPAAIEDEESGARERYGYDASWTAMRGILRIVGEQGMRDVFAAAAAGTTAYRGEVPPERSRLPNDWRRFLDLAEELGGRPGVAELLATWALGPQAAKLLPARDAARRAYARLVDAGDTWAAPVVVRMELDHWDFADATDVIDQAEGILATRDEIVALAEREGLDPGAALEADYEGAGSSAELAVTDERAESTLQVLDDLADAAVAVDAPRDWLTDFGLDGSDPAAGVASARDAWERGDLDTARAAVAAALVRLASAPGVGRSRALAIGGTTGIVIVLLVLLAIALLLRRRRGMAGRRAPAAGRVAASGGPADGPRPYATLPPEGPPAAPPGGPTSGDEGADRS